MSQLGRITAIPNGIDPADLVAASGSELVSLRARYAAPDERLVLLVGRLVFEKGFHLALDALAPIAGDGHACGSSWRAPVQRRPSSRRRPTRLA